MTSPTDRGRSVRTTLGIALIAVVTALGALLAALSIDAGSDDGTVELATEVAAAAAGGRAAEEGLAVVPADRSERESVPGESIAVPEGEPVTPRGAPGASVEPVVLLVGTVTGVAHPEDAELTVAASATQRIRAPGLGGRRLSDEVARGHPDPFGRFRIDVTPLFFRGYLDAAPEWMLLDVEHPDATPQRLSIAVARGGALPDRRALAATGTTVFEARVELVGACILTGVAWSASGPVADAGVAVFDMGSERPLGKPPTAVGRTDGDGRFRLQLEPGRDVAFVCSKGGLRPATRIVRDVSGASIELGAVELDGGHAIAGEVRLGAGREPARVPVFAMLRRGCGFGRYLLPGESRALSWCEDGFEWRSAETETDASGRYTLSGLAGNEYVVHALGVGQPGVEARSTEPVEIRAPALGVVLGSTLARVDLEFWRDGARVPGFEFQVTEGEGRKGPVGTYRTDETGSASLWLPSGRCYAIDGDDEARASLPLEMCTPMANAVVRRVVDL